MGLQAVKIMGWDTARPCYGAATPNIATDATNPGDTLVIQGSATKIIVIHHIEACGQSTGGGVLNVSAVFRSGGSYSGGASSALTLVPFNSGFPAATAAVVVWTTAPTPATGVGNIAARKLMMTAAAGQSQLPVAFNFNTDTQFNPVVLRSATEWLALAFGATAGAGNLFSFWVVWSEYSI